MNFYVTFGSQYPREPHPTWEFAHADGWVLVEAPSYDAARHAVTEWLGSRWSMLYAAEEWEPQYFPRGELAVLTVNADGTRTLHESRAVAVREE